MEEIFTTSQFPKVSPLLLGPVNSGEQNTVAVGLCGGAPWKIGRSKGNAGSGQVTR